MYAAPFVTPRIEQHWVELGLCARYIRWNSSADTCVGADEQPAPAKASSRTHLCHSLMIPDQAGLSAAVLRLTCDTHVNTPGRKNRTDTILHPPDGIIQPSASPKIPK